MPLKKVLTRAGASLLGALLIVVVVVFVALGTSNSADLSYRSLNYDATILANGDMRIVQTIDVRLNERDSGPWRQLYQDYTLKTSNLTSISDVSVTNLSTGKSFSQLDSPRTPSQVSSSQWESSYANHWYLADVTNGTDSLESYDSSTSVTSDRTVEVGWNIPATESANSMRFRVSMTFHGVATAYSDVAALQWEPFGTSNQVPIGTVTGVVRFPDGVTKSNSWAWLHVTGTSTTSRDSDGTLRFTASDVRSGQYLDVVAMFDVNAASGVARHSDAAAKSRIMTEETRQEEEWRAQQRANAVRTVAIWTAIIVFGLAFLILGIRGSVRSNRLARYRGGLDYWRDPPDMSPASAAALLDIAEGGVPSSTLQTRQMSSTVLSLVSKGAIAVYPGPAAIYRGMDLTAASAADVAAALRSNGEARSSMASTSTVVILPVCSADRSSLQLSSSEDAALALLETAARRLKNPAFGLDSLSKAFSGWQGGAKIQSRFVDAAANEFAMLGVTCHDGAMATACGFLALFDAALALAFGAHQGSLALILSVGFPLLVGALLILATKRTEVLTDDDGQKLAGQVVGLKRYLTDFSDFSDRGVADITLWNRYLVYAAAFGISEVAIRQLAKACPQLSDPQWLDANAVGSLIYWSYRPWIIVPSMAGASAGTFVPPQGTAFRGGLGDIGAQLDGSFSQLRSTIAAASAPSNTSGGSFSGGGFGGSFGGSGGGSFGGR
ncbi:DUF2207 domain-containing protein [uncultured Bifidobacterium sp.]|uniref:DUF2207 domain-containing protein n=1 Tax=uncultured Bifidobacterium sp. TaxID=165187 RepID=UPI0026127280|nr:DUF2207 domain-containing protein [uncultured Bifidobacterium sp.]